MVRSIRLVMSVVVMISMTVTPVVAMISMTMAAVTVESIRISLAIDGVVDLGQIPGPRLDVEFPQQLVGTKILVGLGHFRVGIQKIAEDDGISRTGLGTRGDDRAIGNTQTNALGLLRLRLLHPLILGLYLLGLDSL